MQSLNFLLGFFYVKQPKKPSQFLNQLEEGIEGYEEITEYANVIILDSHDKVEEMEVDDASRRMKAKEKKHDEEANLSLRKKDPKGKGLLVT